MSCETCLDDLDDDNKMVAYKDGDICEYSHCRECTEHYIETHFMKFLNDIKHADCEASLRRSLSRKLPKKLTNNLLLSGTEISYFKCGDDIIDAVLVKPKELDGENLNDFQNGLDNIMKTFDEPDDSYLEKIKLLFNKYKI